MLGKVKQLERAGAADLIVLDAPAAGHADQLPHVGPRAPGRGPVGPVRKQAADVVELLTDPTRCQVMLVTAPRGDPGQRAGRHRVRDRGPRRRRVRPGRRERVRARAFRRPRRARGGRRERAGRRRTARRVVPDEQAIALASAAAVPERLARAGNSNSRARLATAPPAPADPAAVPVHRRHRARRGRRARRRVHDGVERSCDPERVVIDSGDLHRRDRAPRHRLLRHRRRREDDDARPRSRSRARAAVVDAVVVTIDPAKRLANTLGLEHLSNTPSEIAAVALGRRRRAPTPVPASSHALMLDTKSTFDQLVDAVRGDDEEQAQRILDNRFYRNIAGALSGTQEYMAMEKLYELHDAGDFDLIVVDTPPTPPRARLPRRAAAAHSASRQPDLPPADGADATGAPRHAARPARLPPHDRARRRPRRHRRRRRVLPRVRRHGGRASATARRRSARLLATPRDRVRARDHAATRRSRRSASTSPSDCSRHGSSVEALS